MSRKKLHTRWQLLLQIVFTIGVLFWLLHNTNWPSLSQRFAEMRPWWFVAAMAPML
ncbi:hypothetical protein [Acidithiobacillus thiooxidans]|uniref:hypothetical protein n=1 Tax=Acidithiobacillus thiooxidans TaxID=930 RepID=UPI0004B0F669|nr:hypothetical protein [Acidithiobacillus thiooxidans]